MVKPKGQKVYVLLSNSEVIGVWSNLKHLCIEMNSDSPFCSYSKLSKDISKLRNEGNETGILKFKVKDEKDYTIDIQYLR
jgi:hypothetical protein